MTWLLAGVLFFLGASILFYVLLAGADFGAGILELFLVRRMCGDQRKLISHAMAPVWEANHIWLILGVVILFMAFPEVYTIASTYLYIPLIAILIGIVARGCAFTFRYYDTLDTEFYGLYSWVFAISSLWTSFFLGVTAGALTLGRIHPSANDFFSLYIAPWWNLFSASFGVFTCSLFAFLAAIYLVGESDDNELRHSFIKRARFANSAVIVAGALVFFSAQYDGIPLHHEFFQNTLSLGSFILATVLLLPLWIQLIRARSTVQIRALGAAIVALVLFGWYAVQYPVALRFQGPIGPSALTFENAAAPDVTLRALLGALIVGSLLIFPALGYLLKVFKWQTFERTKPK